ncbi:MAG: RIP metalloprotease RseP [Clostridia bacterium]|nr:RIP metalloprotease RseP [Clostridia bacterium]
MLNLLAIDGALGTVLSVVLAIAILLIMITVHEFGHYIAGKIFGFKINEFAIGMGPAIFKRQNKKTGELFSIRILPLGGYCAFEGEDENSNEEGAFNTKKPWQRIIVLVAGALLNLILGVFILTLSLGIYGQMLISTYDIRPETAPEYSGYSLVNDDIILKIDGKKVFMATDLVECLNQKSKGDVVTVTVSANGETLDRKVRLRSDVNCKNISDVIPAFTALGVSTIERLDSVSDNLIKGTYLLRVNNATSYEDCSRIFTASDLVSFARTHSVGDTVSYYVLKGTEPYLKTVTLTESLDGKTDAEVLQALDIWQTSTLLKYSTVKLKRPFFETVERGFQYSLSIAGTIFTTLGELLTGKLELTAMGGPVTTITLTSTAIKQGGFNFFLEMMGFIGINLGVFNLLPIPALDGSRIVFTLIEWIFKKPVNRKVEGIIHTVGLLLLLGFSVLVDVLQLF